MNQIERAIYHAIALNPDIAQLLVSPSGGRLRDWVSDEFSKRMFTSIAGLVIQQKKVNPLGIITNGKFSKDEVSVILSEWSSGAKSCPSDFNTLLKTLKDDFVVRSSKEHVGLFVKDIESDPSSSVQRIGVLQSKLSGLAQYGIDYDPTPSAHYNDPSALPTGDSWGCKMFDRMYWGGIPHKGYSLIVGPSNHGKSTILRTQAAYLISQGIPCMICTNEPVMDAGETSRRIRSALNAIWSGERSDTEIVGDIDKYCRIFDKSAGSDKITNIQQWCSWMRPMVTFVDSLDNIDFPPECDKIRDDKEKHRLRALFLSTMNSSGFTVIVGNGSGEEQKAIQKDIDKIVIAQAFGSVWYHNEASYSMVFRRSNTTAGISEVKVVKTRSKDAQIGDMINMQFEPIGEYYRDPSIENTTLIRNN